ncbi:glycosyltransferase family 2 protein [Actinomadura macra]|uniref:glycosyltransferase family 2 protein n=1 Tax=Actinomadura macra TaxID=46164 RepID=UPI000836DAC7|nr:glycosyltransferase family 2 protein [Actinomadura macra]
MRPDLSGTTFLGADAPVPQGDGVSIIVLTYRSARYIGDCVAALRHAAGHYPAELIIVDNDSGDETPDVARAAAPDARVIETGHNGGFAHGCHAGAERARFPWLMFVNPDTVPAPGSIEALLDCARSDPAIGIVGGRCVGRDGSADPRSWWGRPGLWPAFCFAFMLSSAFPGSRVFDPESPRPWTGEEQVRRVPVVTGGFMLVSRRAWNETGGFDKGFFMYAEDADLCLRAAARGYRPTVTGRGVYQHDVGGSSSSIGKLVLLFTGKTTLLRRHLRPGLGHLAVGLLAFGVLARAVLSRLLSARPERQGRATARGEDWRKLWAARREWLPGWPRR